MNTCSHQYSAFEESAPFLFRLILCVFCEAACCLPCLPLELFALVFEQHPLLPAFRLNGCGAPLCRPRFRGSAALIGHTEGKAMGNHEEQRHLEQTLAILHEALGRASNLLDSIDGAYRETKFHLAESRGEIDPQEMQHSHLALIQIDRQAAAAAASKAQLEKLLASPYFARVDFAAEGGAEPQPTYIGRFSFSWESRSLISDWRAPVASLFYDFEPGPAFYDAPTGRLDGQLVLKRQFRIEDGRLVYAVDSESSVRDEVLQLELSRTSSSKMRTIVSSIQREQNTIIRDERPGTLVIQGVAGSGKTSIALHRIAYLLYRQKERLTSKSVVVLSPNRVFGDYIAGVLPELGEEPVGERSLFDVAANLLQGVAKVQPPRSFVDDADDAWRERARFKSTRAFAQQADEYARRAAEGIFQACDLRIGRRTVSAAWLAERFDGYGNLPLDERLDLLAGDALAQAASGTFGRDRDALPKRREVRAQLSRMLRDKSPLALYRRFFKDIGRPDMFCPPAAGTVEWEDAYPLILFRAAFAGDEEFRDVKHLVIDEMQDLSTIQHMVVARLFPCDKTVLGDCNQLVDDRESLTLEEVAACYPGARTTSLMRSYRSTFEIARLAARVKPVAGLEAVERHGEEPRFVPCRDTRDVLSRVDEAIRAFRQGGRRTLGIIHKSDALARRYAELIACEHEVDFAGEDSTTFSDGVTVCSVKMAKGLEFDEVVLLDADAAQYAAPADRNLLYVAVTRAMHKLTVLYRAEPSPFFGLGANARKPPVRAASEDS